MALWGVFAGVGGLALPAIAVVSVQACQAQVGLSAELLPFTSTNAFTGR